MKKLQYYCWFFLFVFSVLIQLPQLSANEEQTDQPEFEHYLSVCAIFQDEAPYLKEWIEFHRLMGVSHFWMYNNNSTDNYLEVLAPYIAEGLVDLKEWPSRPDKNYIFYQRRAYNDCIKKSRDKTHWLAVIDIDEFLFPTQADRLTEVLPAYEEFGGVKVFWQMYGTSDVQKIPEGELLTEHLTKKFHPHYFENNQYKSIVMPRKVSHYDVHEGHYFPPYYDVTTSGERNAKKRNIPLDILRINHYFTRDEDFFYNVKIPRKQRSGRPQFGKNSEKIKQFLKMSNEFEDKAIFRFIPELKMRMEIKS